MFVNRIILQVELHVRTDWSERNVLSGKMFFRWLSLKWCLRFFFFFFCFIQKLWALEGKEVRFFTHPQLRNSVKNQVAHISKIADTVFQTDIWKTFCHLKFFIYFNLSWLGVKFVIWSDLQTFRNFFFILNHIDFKYTLSERASPELSENI